VATDVIEVVAFLIFVVLLGSGAVALARATRAARRPPKNADPWPEGFRYTYFGFLANLIARAPRLPADSTTPPAAADERSDEPR
jgi:hypothetical protein